MTHGDPFASDPNVKQLEHRNYTDATANWKAKKSRRATQEPDLDRPGPCDECGSDVIAHDGLGWCCAECGQLRFFPVANE